VEIRQGDLFWMTSGFRGIRSRDTGTPSVIQNNLFNQSKINTVVVCALTFQSRKGKSAGEMSCF